MTPEALATLIMAKPAKHPRKVVGVAGPPASGKSTLAGHLATLIPNTQVVPMDGFHLDNTTLEQMDLLARKGAPQTFDASGFVNLVGRLGRGDALRYPIFDRDRDAVVEDAKELPTTCETVIVEGNYLLLDEAPWTHLGPAFDLTVFLSVDKQVLSQRLLQRWRDQGLSEAAAQARALENDLPNAMTVIDRSVSADLTITA